VFVGCPETDCANTACKIYFMIERIVLLSLTAIAICCTMWEGMIFEKLGDWIEKQVGEFWAKPLGKCYVCFTFWFSLIACFWLHWPLVYAIPAMGLSAVISRFDNN
jgi:hypothetical protein